MSESIPQLTARYYRDFAGGGDFTRVPMARDFRFDGPLHQYRGGERYRADCERLASAVTSLSIRHQFFDGDRAWTVYDVDVGLDAGPIATSEVLTFADGVMVAADLFLDTTLLRAAES